MGIVTITQQRSPVKGGNRAEFFQLSTTAFDTQITHVEDRTTSLKTTGHPNKKDLKVSFEAQHADSAFETFLSSYLTNQDLTATSITYEDGQVETASGASSSQMFGYVVYFGVKGTQRKVLYGVGVLTGDTGNYETSNNQFEKTPVEITAVPAPYTLTIAAAKFNTNLVTSAATVTIAAGSYGAYTFLTAV